MIEPGRGDRRFQADEWRDNAWYSLLEQTYLLNARLLDDMVEASDLDAKAKHKARFFARQFIDSMSPANFAATNPDALRLALETGGESVKAGLDNLLADLKRGRISITDETAFEVGRNVAVSKGSVVFENALFQLIQYAPLTEQVAHRPLLIVPPCINKFYILDLQPENSFVRFAGEQGQTVFLMSWCNPGPELGQTTLGRLRRAGRDQGRSRSRWRSAAPTRSMRWAGAWAARSCRRRLAVLRARGDKSLASLTLLTTMLDFSSPGDLGVFIDEQRRGAARAARSAAGGIYPGKELGFVFQTLRANDLIWPYVVIELPARASRPRRSICCTGMPTAPTCPDRCTAWYLRNMYLENNLCVPNRLTMCDTTVDLGRIDMPSYVLATQEDHIVPWRAAYRTTQLLGGKSQFVLGASGHIAGVINPASKNKRSYWIDGSAGRRRRAMAGVGEDGPGQLVDPLDANG